MKKILFLSIVTAIAVQTVSAQKLEESKFKDNWFVGAAGGATTQASSMDPGNTLEWQLGLHVGRWFTPYFALGLEGHAYFGKSGHFSVSRTAFNVWNVNLLGMFHLNNLFKGYKGEPRPFEFIAFAGVGGAGLCGASWKYVQPNYSDPHPNSLTCPIGLTIAYNCGSRKQWQAFVEPRITYELANENKNVQFNLSSALFAINVGINYYFRNTNGTHNFKLYEIPDMEAINSNINELRSNTAALDSMLTDKNEQLASKDAQIANLNKQLMQKNVTITNLQPTVIFRQGKSIIDPAQFAPIEMIAKYMESHPEARVVIKGYASPEGPELTNKQLSEERAEAVRLALIKKYGIDADRLTAIGCGVTDQLFDEIEFNRVVTFNDDTKE